ncbi:hypothetical protein GYMLUDRAFT_249931 [Collybiopsis luxurians FD-317 M1]|uniref:Uncharacterized protein n=1 Tax=Collybiopsis luxurians FD-317 M1 TaxID=944289 RepID=A0A0D0BGP6_9AGAR|nr:hypothetical protein GYMLUDRAFT_249931 [Collybiopsis luxurians FD-317 M1]
MVHFCHSPVTVFNYPTLAACHLSWDFFVLKLDISDQNPTTDQIEELMGPEHEDGEVDSDIEDKDNEMDIN